MTNPDQNTNRVSIVVFQPTSACNLNCDYCYVPNRRDKARMPDHILDRAITNILHSELVQNDVQFLWHVGEPLLAGIDFFQRMTEIVCNVNHRRIEIEQSLQTNATLISDDWCEFFKSNNFSVGISIDGPASIHDAHRKNWNGKASHSKVMTGYNLLQKHKIRAGALCVLTKNSLRFPREIFEFFVDQGFESVAFNVEETENANHLSSLSNRNIAEIVDEYRKFMETIFDLQQQRFSHVEIRELNQIYRVLSRKRKQPSYFQISAEVLPLHMITILKNGDISTYCPEFAGMPSNEYNNFVIGNILTNQLDELPTSYWFRRIKADVDRSIAMCASSCRYFDLGAIKTSW